jgi:hypothetical protein
LKQRQQLTGLKDDLFQKGLHLCHDHVQGHSYLRTTQFCVASSANPNHRSGLVEGLVPEVRLGGHQHS